MRPCVSSLFATCLVKGSPNSYGVINGLALDALFRCTVFSQPRVINTNTPPLLPSFQCLPPCRAMCNVPGNLYTTTCGTLTLADPLGPVISLTKLLLHQYIINCSPGCGFEGSVLVSFLTVPPCYIV